MVGFIDLPLIITLMKFSYILLKDSDFFTKCINYKFV